MDSLVILIVEIVIGSSNASSEHDPGFVVPDSDQSNFSGNVKENPHMTASSRLNSNTGVN